MPRNAGTGVYTRVVNSFSQPVFGTLIDPTDADAYFDDLDVGLNPPSLAGPVTIVGALTVSGALGSGAHTITSASASALAVGLNGATNPVLQVDASAALQANGVRIFGGPLGTGPGIAVISGGTNEGLSLNAKGSGVVLVQNVGTGAITLGTATTLSAALTYGGVTLSNSVTGTGSMALSISPTFTGTATFAALTATTFNKVTITAPATSATLTLIDGTVITGPAATGTLMTKTSTDVMTNKTFNSTGTGNVLQVSGVTVSAGQYPGEPSTGNATAGNVGEVIDGSAALGSVSLTNATPANITSISLTAGDWEVYGTVYYSPAATTNFTILQASTNVTTATVDTAPGNFGEVASAGTITGANVVSVSPGQPKRYSLSSTTTVFLTTNQTFTVSTMTAGGKIHAIRAR